MLNSASQFSGNYAGKGRKMAKKTKAGTVMKEFYAGELHSGSKKGPKVKNPKQAKAIAMSEQRKAGGKKMPRAASDAEFGVR